MNTQSVDIPISESDLEDFKDIIYKNDTITWIFKDKEGNDIELRFMSEDECEQRQK